MALRPELANAMRAAHVIDLTLTLSEDLPCTWPGATGYRHWVDHWFATTSSEEGPPVRCRSGAPYQTYCLLIDEHAGTHFDAPSHFIPPPGSGLPGAGPSGEVTAERVALDQFFGAAAVVDVRHLAEIGQPGLSPRIEPSLVTDWENTHDVLGPGDVVLFRSGWDKNYVPGPDGQNYAQRPLSCADASGWPAPSPATMELLRDRGVRCVGTDGASMGPADDGAPVHIVGLGAGMVFVEALCHLDTLPERGATFFFLPLKVEGGSGGPGRAIAFV